MLGNVETQMAEKVNELTSDLMTTAPNCKPRKVGDKLLAFLLCLIRAARKLGRRVLEWFGKVNKEQFCNVIIMWATIVQKQLHDQVHLGRPMRTLAEDTAIDIHDGVDLRNLSIVYHIIDYIGTFEEWGLGDLETRLDEILSSSHQSQRVLRYMNIASPHIHGGSWLVLTQARSYLRTFRTFSDFRRMNPNPSKLDEVVKTYAAKALLDTFQTENAARYRVLLNSQERKRVIAKNLNKTHSPHSLNTQHSVNLQQLPRGTRQTIVHECQRFWAHDEIAKIKRWINEGLPSVDLARGIFHFSRLCMYPSSRMIDTFLTAAAETKSGIDGDAIIGYLEISAGPPPCQLRTPVKVFQFFSQDGISSHHLHILGPVLSRENTNLVQQKFNYFTKYGYKHNLWKNYKSFLRYGFEVNVEQLDIKEHLKKKILTFSTKSLPEEIKNRSIYLYAHLKKCFNLSELPLTIIFEFDGIQRWCGYARSRMELKRQKSVMQLERYRELKAKKREFGKATMITSTLEIQSETSSKNQGKNPVLNDNEGIGPRSGTRNAPALKVTAEMDNSSGLSNRTEQKEDYPTSTNEQSLIGK